MVLVYAALFARQRSCACCTSLSSEMHPAAPLRTDSRNSVGHRRENGDDCNDDHQFEQRDTAKRAILMTLSFGWLFNTYPMHHYPQFSASSALCGPLV